MSNISQEPSVVFIVSYSLCLNYFHLSKSSFTCPGLRVSGLARRLKLLRQYYHISICQMLLNCSAILSEGHILTSVAFMMSQLL
jgi:hypothetical protein